MMPQTRQGGRGPFEPGQPVRVSARASLGHCRTPHYLRGHQGTVIGVCGRYRNPEQLAYHRPGLPMLTLYRVRFAQCDLWPDYGGAESDQLEADIFEHWLDPADEETAP